MPEVLEGRPLLFARVAWLSITSILLGLVTIGFVRAYSDPQLVAISAVTDLFVEFGLGLRLMITLALAGPFLAVVIVAIFIFMRRSSDPMALLLTGTLLFSYSYVTRSLVALDGVPLLEHALSIAFAIAMILISLTLALFPNGVFVPRWSTWLPISMTLLVISGPDTGTVLMTVIEQDATITGRTKVLGYGWALILLVGLISQVLRYRQASTHVERQQTKWVMAPFGVTMVVLIGLLVASVAVPNAPDRVTGWIIFAAIPLNFLIPISVAIAVLRYRLYDIDRILSRTVGYTLTVAILALAYTVGAIWLPSQFAGDSPLFVAGSTLAVAGMFNPIRRRALRWVDRRFYRSRFDFENVVERFSTRLKDPTDPEGLIGDWIAVVVETMRPASIGAWIRSDPNPRRGEPAN